MALIWRVHPKNHSSAVQLDTLPTQSAITMSRFYQRVCSLPYSADSIQEDFGRYSMSYRKALAVYSNVGAMFQYAARWICLSMLREFARARLKTGRISKPPPHRSILLHVAFGRGHH
jgi:hypothetical protein